MLQDRVQEAAAYMSARRSRVHYARFACSVRARRNRSSISITRGGTSDPRRKSNCNRRGSHRRPGWEDLRHRNHIVPRAEDGAMKEIYRNAGWSPALRKECGPWLPLFIPGGNGGRCRAQRLSKTCAILPIAGMKPRYGRHYFVLVKITLPSAW